MPFTEIRCEVADGVCTITLNRPERLNAFTPTMMRELHRGVRPGRRRRRGPRGDRHRSGPRLLRRRRPAARADGTFDYGEQRDAASRIRDGGGLVTLRIFESKKPVIAAINGPAVGRRRHDDAADGHPHRVERRPLRLRLRPPRHRARGGIELVPAAARRHQPGGRVVLHRPRLPRRRGARRTARESRRSARHPARHGARRWRARSPTTPRPSRSPSRARCCGACSAPTIRWRPTRSTPG